MKKTNERNRIKEWYNRFDEKLKSLRDIKYKMNLVKSEIIDNQKLLSEYKMDEQNKDFKKKKIGRINVANDIDKKLLNRVNINNYKELDNDNIFLKRVLEKIKERKENIKKGKKLQFKRYKTNNDYGNINYNYILNERGKNNNLQNLKIIISKNGLNNEDKKDIIKKEKPLMIKHKTNLILNLNTEQNKNEEYSVKDIINYNYNKNNTENNVCFFETLSHNDNYEIKSGKSKQDNNIKNMIKIFKKVNSGLQNCELSGNILNRNIQKTKDILNFKNSPSQKKDNKKVILKINYSKVKDLRDVEKHIFKNSKQENIKNNKSVSVFKLKQKNAQNKDITKYKDKDKNKIPTKLLVLPICTSHNKSYIKTSAKNVLI